MEKISIRRTIEVLKSLQMEAMIWQFDDCPVKELEVYHPTGKELCVVLAHKESPWIAYRLGNFQSALSGYEEKDAVQLNFGEEYHLFIVIEAGPDE